MKEVIDHDRRLAEVGALAVVVAEIGQMVLFGKFLHQHRIPVTDPFEQRGKIVLIAGNIVIGYSRYDWLCCSKPTNCAVFSG